MKHFTQKLLLTSIILTTSSIASASWLDKGMDFFKQTPASDSKGESKDGLLKSLTNGDIQAAFKEALSIGSEKVVGQLSKTDGFNSDPKIHISLPGSLNTVKTTLDKFGMGGMTDDLELKLNRAAEAATPEAKALFLNAIKDMSFEDVQAIYKGPQDSATQYLKSKTSEDLKAKMAPIIDRTLNEVGAVKAYDSVMSKYKGMPMVPDVKANLLEHVTEQGMNGMFYYLAQQEEAIRKDPVKQSTELLKKVFGK